MTLEVMFDAGKRIDSILDEFNKTKPSSEKQLESLFEWLRPKYKVKGNKLYELTEDYFQAKRKHVSSGDMTSAEYVLEKHEVNPRRKKVKQAFKYFAKNALLTELLETKMGQCISFSTLFVVLSRRLNYQAKCCDVTNYYGKMSVNLVSKDHACAAVFHQGERALFDLTHGIIDPPHGVRELTDEEAYGRAYGEKGVIYGQDGDFKKALEFLKKGLKHYPTCSMLWYNKGIAYQELEKHEKADTCFVEALQLNPENFRAKQILSKRYWV